MNISHSFMEVGPDRLRATMNHRLFPSVAAMLDPKALGDLLGESVTDVFTRPLLTDYNKSGSYLLRVEINHGRGPHLILKHISLDTNWLMRATSDDHCRSVALWTHGLLDLMPPEIDHATISCARDGGNWVILLRDVSDQLLPFEPFNRVDNEFMLEAMAALHATFFESPLLTNPELGLCNLYHIYTMFSPQTGQREVDGEDEVPKRILEGWDMVKTTIPPDVADIIMTLLDSPTPLCDALGRYPQTLVHGDWRHANQGLERNDRSRLILLDWQLATVAPPAVELGRGLATNSPLLPVSKEETISYYKQRLAQRLGPRFSEDWWEPQLALSLLGGFLQDGWAIVLKSTHWHVGAKDRKHWMDDLAWWSDWVRAGAEWL